MSGATSAESGISEDAQIRAITEYCNKVKLKVNQGLSFPPEAEPGFFIDRAVSGKTDICERPAGCMMLSQLEPGDHIVFYNIERAFRSIQYFSHYVDSWIRRGITPHFVQHPVDFGSAHGKLVANVLASLAQYYSDITSQRTREAKAISKAIRSGEAKGDGKPKKREKSKWLPSDVIQFSKTAAPAVSSGTVRIYNRVSHLDQKLSGLSTEQQRQANLSYAERLASDNPGLTVHSDMYEDESVSAFKKKFHERPSGKRLIADLQPGDHVICYRTDRAFRRPADTVHFAEMLEKRGCILHIIEENIHTDTEWGRTWLTLMSVFSHIESLIKSERNKSITDNKRANGMAIGTTPIHCSIHVDSDGQKRLIHDEDKMVSIALVWVMRQIGFEWVEISKHLTRAGYKARGKRNVWKVSVRWEKLMEELPNEVAAACVKQAAAILEGGSVVKQVNVIGNLVRSGIPEWLEQLLPSRKLSSSA